MLSTSEASKLIFVMLSVSEASKQALNADPSLRSG